MNKHQLSIENYGKCTEQLHNELIGFVLNIVTDKEGSISAQTNFTKDIFLLRDNILYRSSAIERHIQNICQQHVYFEQVFKTNPQKYNLIGSHNIQSFSFDDFIFNLLSLYDYYANLLAFFFTEVS